MSNIVMICSQGKLHQPDVTVIATSENITFNSVERLDSGSYKCLAKNSQGPEVSAQVTIHVTCKYWRSLWLIWVYKEFWVEL